MSCCLTAEDIRNYILDRTIADNDLLLDLNFSEAEIQNAMVRAAREYNSIPPLVGTVSPACLPSDTNIFLDGVVAHLYLSEMSKLMRNDIDYDSGGVQTNLVAKRINHLKDQYKLHMERFKTTVKEIKISINVERGFWHF